MPSPDENCPVIYRLKLLLREPQKAKKSGYQKARASESSFRADNDIETEESNK
jgi:hypothetical protein